MEINFEEISFFIISYCGEAKSIAMDAISIMKKTKNVKEALDKINEAEKLMIEAEKKHMDVITDEANGIMHTPTVLFLHAEDQMLSTQTLMLMAREIIQLYDIIYTKIIK
ncbi:PTS lactose/cellobiose transporter subunit IIA [Spiroplasma endosymbiont of Aspidapion aeneum]|uniref:PTS lactose/cellobiose transporter subunit IIA n=1 Tax=Spiroplasma endosymbiont of Aspidapion aeneum TaxID=3066276 RepID=UPI00313C8AC3